MTSNKIKTARISNEILTLFLVLVIICLAYAMVVRFFDFRRDLTATKQFSLSDTSLKLLEKIKTEGKPIKVTIFYRPNKSPEESMKRRKVIDLLGEYHLRSGKLIALPVVINPDQRPDEVKRLGIRNIGSVAFEIVEKEKETKEVSTDQILAKRQIASPRDIWGIRMIDGKPGPEEFKGENAFSTALKRLQSRKQRAAVFVQGHGEYSIGSREVDGYRDFAEGLEQANFSVQNVNLFHEQKIPETADLVVIAGPRKTYLPTEDTILTDYAKNGGHLLILAEFNVDMGLNKLLTFLGVEVGKNLILEPERAFQGNMTVPIPQFGEHPIVNDLRASGENTLLNTVRSVERALGDTTGITTANLLMTSPSAWAEVDYSSVTNEKKKAMYNAGSGDIKGPVTMAMAVNRAPEKKFRSDETRAVIIGDSEFATNDIIKFGANKDLLLNSANWLVGQESEIGISPKDNLFNLVTMTNRQVWIIFGIVMVMLPGVVLAGGIFQWLSRRSL